MAASVYPLIIVLVVNITSNLCQKLEHKYDYVDTPPPCVVPQPPEHGTLASVDPSESATPGDVVSSFLLNVTCDDGYNLVGYSSLLCLPRSYISEMPRCVRNCERDAEDAHVVRYSSHPPEERECYDTSYRNRQIEIFDRSSSHDLVFQLINNCTSPRRFSRSTDPKIIHETLVVVELTTELHHDVSAFASSYTAVREDTPWHVGVYTKTTRPYKNICGGSVISSLVVISAAHCFWNDVRKQLPAAKFAVAAGKLFRPFDDPRDEYAQKSDVVSIRIPPRYQGITTHFQSDLALLVVAAPFRYEHHVYPVCLDFDYNRDEADLQKGILGKVSGWGLVGEDGQQAAELQVGELPVVGIDDCITGVSAHFKSYITSDKICAGYTNGTALCKGDSGGGLAFRSTTWEGSYSLRGVVSTAPRNDKPCNVHSWATFTHVAAYERFIMSVLSEVHG